MVESLIGWEVNVGQGSECHLTFVRGILRPFFPEIVMSTDLLSFEHPSVLLFCFILLNKIPVSTIKLPE